MRLFLLLVIFCCCVLVGIKIKEYFKRRQYFYQNFCNFCETLQNKISFNNQKINLILQEEIDSVGNTDFKKFLLLFLEYTNNQLSTDGFKQQFYKNFNFLNRDEQQEYFSFLVKFGTLSKEEELSNVTNYLLKFNKQLEEIKQSNLKYSNFYFKLFLILGLTFIVIFI